MSDKCYSTDEETFNHESITEAIESLDGAEVGNVIYEGEATKPKPSEFFDVDWLIENLGERAYDECGEWAEDWPDVPKEKRDELAALIGAWLNANIPVHFWNVTNVKPISITQEMIDEATA